ncbi:MAG TPA: PAC2 family protein [Acidimicrobiales bacterium]|nr:PAC2 family protein [Acidimicrobiales bacterium]
MSLYEFHERPDLESPVLVLALDGWIDAGGAAALAAATVLESGETTPVVTFDADVLLDHRARRPIMHIEAGLNTGLSWPSIEIVALSDPSGADVLVLRGAEPDHQWRAFADAVVALALELGVGLVVGLGAYPAPVPHTRPSRLASTATDRALADRVGFLRSTIDVPAGVHGAIEERCAAVGLPAVGIWAQVPHYASGMAYPAAAMALIEKLNDLGNLALPAGDLAEESATVRARLDALVTESAEHVELLRQLEANADSLGADDVGGVGPDELPSGDELAGEIERFLRDQGR